VPARATYDRLAVLAFVLGLFWGAGLGSLLAVILGHVARTRVRSTGERGAGLAFAGIVLGWIGIIGAAVVGLTVFVATK
jgi:hypothetical protein